MLDANLPSPRAKLQDALALGSLIRLLLLGNQGKCDVDDLLGWQLFEHIGLPAPKLELFVALQQLMAGAPPRSAGSGR